MGEPKKAPPGNGRHNPVAGCPLTAALAAVGGKRKLIIVYWLAEAPRHFAALRQAMPGISLPLVAEARAWGRAHLSRATRESPA